MQELSTYQLLDELLEEVGDDIFAFSGGIEIRHALLESVIAGILSGVLTAFLTKALDVEEAGRKTREHLKQTKFLAEKNIEGPLSHEDLAKLIEIVNKSGQEGSSLRVASIAEELVEIGIDRSTAQRISLSVVRTWERQFSKVRS